MTARQVYIAFLAPFALSLGIFIGACTTAPQAADPTQRQTVIANAVEDTLAVGLVPVLTKNPAYLPEARTAANLIATFTGTELRAADVDALLAKVKLSPDDARAVAGLVNAAWDTYQRRYAEQVGRSLRPDVKLFLAAVARGIDRAVAALPKE